MKLNFKITFIFIFLFNFLEAQIFNLQHDIFSPVNISPAYSVVDGNSILFIGYSKMWTGINGAPNTTSISFDSPVFDRFGISGQLENYSHGNFSDLKSNLAATIKIKITKKSSLAFASGLKFFHSYFNFSQAVQQAPDPIFTNAASLKSNVFDLDFASIYIRKNLILGISAKSVLQSENQYAATQTQFPNYTEITTHISYFFGINKDLFIEPSAVAVFQPSNINDKFNLRFSILTSYKKYLHFFSGYELNNSLTLGFGISASHNFLISYSYQTSFSEISKISDGTHFAGIVFLLKRKSEFSNKDLFPSTREQIIAQNNEIEINNLKKETEDIKKHFNKIISEQNNKIEKLLSEENIQKIVPENNLYLWSDSAIFYNIKFATNTKLLQTSSLSEIKQIVNKMFENPELVIKIYADVKNSGSPVFTQNLRNIRSQEIKKIIVEKGISDKRILIGTGKISEAENIKILYSKKIYKKND